MVMRVINVANAAPPKKMIFVTLANDDNYEIQIAAYTEPLFQKLEEIAKVGRVSNF